MQKLISKYGLAAHLALLAVAPLIVFPYLVISDISKVVLWLSLLCFTWFINGPSRINNERSTHEARKRVSKAVVGDPAFWLLCVITMIAGICALNNAVELAYDAENYIWYMTEPAITIMPFSMGDAGFPVFVSSLLMLVVYTISKHALGKSARGALGYMVGVLAGIAGILAVYEYAVGNETIRALAKCSLENPAFVGGSFGIALLIFVPSIAHAFERKWNAAIVTLPIATGGIIAAMFLFSPAYLALSYLLAAILILAYDIFWATKHVGKSTALKILALFSIGAALAGMILYGFSFNLILEKFADVSPKILSLKDLELSSRLSAISVKIWQTNLWLGSGIGTFPQHLRFNATDEDWSIISSIAQVTPINGWAYLMVERGIVGALLLALPICFIVWGYVSRIITAVKEVPSPFVMAGPLSLLIVGALTYFNTSIFRMESLPLLLLAMALSINSWVKEKKDDGK